jgi:hypothetical protein
MIEFGAREISIMKIRAREVGLGEVCFAEIGVWANISW